MKKQKNVNTDDEKSMKKILLYVREQLDGGLNHLQQCQGPAVKKGRTHTETSVQEH